MQAGDFEPCLLITSHLHQATCYSSNQLEYPLGLLTTKKNGHCGFPCIDSFFLHLQLWGERPHPNGQLGQPTSDLPPNRSVPLQEQRAVILGFSKMGEIWA